MIAGLKGVLAEKSAMEAIVDVQGVAYRVAISAMASGRLPEVGAPVSLRIRTVVREDALDLYGFLSRTEEELFEHLTSVSQVGPKMALNVLSGLDVNDLIAALARGEVAKPAGAALGAFGRSRLGPGEPRVQARAGRNGRRVGRRACR